MRPFPATLRYLPPLSTAASPLSSYLRHPTATLRCHHHWPPRLVKPLDHYPNNASKYWDNFYKRHSNKFFKDRHYLEKDWGQYFSDGQVVLEVGCGAGNTVFPLIAAYPDLYVHACDFSPHAIELVKSHGNFKADQLNAFVCNVANDSLCDKIPPCSVDIVTLIFMLSAVPLKKMPGILRNIRHILKPNAYVLFRDYAVGDYAQVKLKDKDRMIGENFYVRGDGTCSFYFTKEVLSNLFWEARFDAVDVSIYAKKIKNRSRGVIMDRNWIRGVFRKNDSTDSVFFSSAGKGVSF